MQDNYFLIHGSYGNPYKNFLPWLKSELSIRRLSSITPNFTTPYKQDYESWSKILNAYYELGYINETTTFICHSLGAIFVVKYLTFKNIKIKTLITIAGFNNTIFNDDMNLYNSFYLKDEDLSKIKDLTTNRYSFYSNNDPYISENELEYFSNKIEAEKILIQNAGHFSSKELKELLKYI